MALPVRLSVLLFLCLAPAAALAQSVQASRTLPATASATFAARADTDDLWQDEAKPSPSFAPYSQAPATYRTLCVRLCDGYYFPISFRTTRLGIETDAARCTARCGEGAALFFHPNPGGEVAAARTFTGMHYEALPNAFRHLKQKVPGCTCSPEPWTVEERQRHQGYAAAARAKALEARSEPAVLQGGERPLALMRRAGPPPEEPAAADDPLSPESGSEPVSAPEPAVAPEPVAQDAIPHVAPSPVIVRPATPKRRLVDKIPRRLGSAAPARN